MNECNVYLKFYAAIVNYKYNVGVLHIMKYLRFIVTACDK